MVVRLCLVTLLALAAATMPGIQAGLSQDTIDAFKKDVLPQVIAQYNSVEPEDYYRQIGSGFFATNIVVSKIRCTGLSMDVNNSNLVMVAPDSLVLTATGLTGKMSFRWSYESPLGGDSGEGAISLQPTSITAKFLVSEAEGKPVVTVSSMQFQISGLDISISNSPIASVANWLSSVFKEDILAGLTEVFNQYGADLLTSVISNFLSKYQTQMQLTDSIAIDYSLVLAPQVSDSSAQVNILGVFVDLTHPGQIMPGTPGPLPSFNPAGEAVQVYISEYTLNTGLYAGMTSGSFQGKITNSTPTVGPYMTTFYLSALFPGLTDVYGQSKPCSLDCRAAEPAPTFTAVHGDLTGQFTMSCDLLVETTKAISVDTTAIFETEVSLSDWSLHLNMTYANVTNVRTYDSTLTQPADDQKLMEFMDTIVANFVPKTFNSLFGDGIPLPSLESVDLTSAEFTIEDGYLAISVTPVYHIVAFSPS